MSKKNHQIRKQAKFINVKRIISTRLFIETNSDYRNTVILAGTGRSGTTWVSDIINYNNDYRYIFEPFNPEELILLKNFEYRQFIRPNNRKTKYIVPVRQILSGRFRNEWTDRFNKKIICKKRLIKDIRINLLLKWIKTNFPEIKIILLLRNPCAIANSKLKLNWDTHLDVLLSQQDLLDDFLRPFEEEIRKAKTIFEKHIFQWCIENYVPLKQFQKEEICIIYYEKLCTKPKEEIGKLFSFLGKKNENKVYTKLKVPSLLSKKTSAIITGVDLVNGWKDNINKNQQERAKEILSLFNLENIY